MSRPSTTRIENLMSVADAVVWVFLTYGFPRCTQTGARPKNESNFKAVCDTVAWAWGEE